MKFNELIKELNKDLKGKEMNYHDLDAYMVSKGFYTVFGDGFEEDIREDENTVYILMEDTCKRVILYFHITTTYSSDDYDTLYFDLIVNEVSEI